MWIIHCIHHLLVCNAGCRNHGLHLFNHLPHIMFTYSCMFSCRMQIASESRAMFDHMGSAHMGIGMTVRGLHNQSQVLLGDTDAGRAPKRGTKWCTVSLAEPFNISSQTLENLTFQKLEKKTVLCMVRILKPGVWMVFRVVHITTQT